MRNFIQKFMENRLLIFILLWFILLLPGCSVSNTAETPTITASPTMTEIPSPTIDWFPATPTPTFLPINSPTPQPTLSVDLQGITTLLVEDDFTDPRQWLLTQNSTGNAAFGNQNLTLAVSKQDVFLTSLSQHSIPNDFYLEVTIENALCQSQDQFGIDFWYQSANDYHRLLLNCSGQYRLELVQGGRSIVLHDWETGSKIKVGSPAVNHLGLWALDGQFQLFINDTFQFEERISSNQNGDLGVFAKAINSSAMTVQFSNLKIYHVE